MIASFILLFATFLWILFSLDCRLFLGVKMLLFFFLFYLNSIFQSGDYGFKEFRLSTKYSLYTVKYSTIFSPSFCPQFSFINLSHFAFKSALSRLLLKMHIVWLKYFIILYCFCCTIAPITVLLKVLI